MFIFLIACIFLYCPTTYCAQSAQLEQPKEFTITRTVRQSKAHIRLTTTVRHNRTQQEVEEYTDYTFCPKKNRFNWDGTSEVSDLSNNRYQNFMLRVLPKSAELFLKELPNHVNKLSQHANLIVHFDRTQFPAEAKKEFDSGCCIL